MSCWIVLCTKHGKSVLVTSLQSTQTLLLNPLQHQYLSQHFVQLGTVKSQKHHAPPELLLQKSSGTGASSRPQAALLCVCPTSPKKI